MVLDARLKKLAGGISATKAARALARSHASEVLSDLERQQADEFAATIEAMFLMAAVDGHVSTEEIGQLEASIAALADMEIASGLRLRETLADLNARLGRDGWRARLEDVARRIPTPDGKAFAFRLAAGVAFVDDEVAHSEAAAIEAFAAALGLSSAESQEILRDVHEELFGG
jgi:tellurite resistance protein